MRSVTIGGMHDMFCLYRTPRRDDLVSFDVFQELDRFHGRQGFYTETMIVKFDHISEEASNQPVRPTSASRSNVSTSSVMHIEFLQAVRITLAALI